MPDETNEPGDLVTCPSCGKIWPKGTKFCTLCGTWIETGQVLDPTVPPKPAPPAQPAIGGSPPGIGPSQGGVPPQAPRFRPGAIPSPPPGGGLSQSTLGPGPVSPAGPPPGGMPGQPPPPPQGMAGPPEAEAPKKKYSFLTESRREEHVPQGPMFIPKREEKKKKRVGIRQIIIVVICMLAIAYAVISMAFKPLHGYLMGTVFEFAGKPEQAMKYYRKAAGSDGMWSEKASAAMTRIGKGVVKRHVETQFGGNWTAKTKITIQGRTTPIQLKSDLAYRAPGFIAERIRRTEPDAPAGQRLLNDQLYGVQFGTGFSEGPISIEAFSERIEQRAGLKMSELFDKANTDRVVQVLFDDLGMKLDEVIGEGPNKTYQFSIDVTDDVDRLRKLEAVMTPFFPWGEWRLRSRQRDIVRVELNFLEKEGLLEEVCYYDANGGIVAQQVFEDLNPGATVDDSLFR